jgi:nucleotide-binding universal stress UspA family protein
LEEDASAADIANLSGSIGLGARTSLIEELAELDAKRAKLAQQQGRAVLEDANAILKSAGISNAQEKLRTGNLIETVRIFEKDADMLVIGKRGNAADFEKMHLGSNLERVVRACTKPVFVASRQFEPISRCLVAFDGSEAVMRALVDLCKNELYNGLDITLVSVTESLTVEEQIKLDQARERLENADRQVDVKVLAGTPSKVIGQEVQSGGYGLVVMGAFGHSSLRSFFIGSTTTKIIKSCLVPIVLYH